MNFKRFLAAVALVATSAVTLNAAAAAQSKNTFVARSFSTDMARELMAEQSAWTMNADSDSWHGTFQVIGQYNRNFKSNSATGLGAMPFWSGTNSMTVGSNASTTTTAYDLDSYQFGLGLQATAGTVALNPIVYNAGADFLFYVGAHQTETGFWGKINAAVGVTSVNPQLTEATENTGVAYVAGAMNTYLRFIVLGSAIYDTMTEAFAGGAVASTPTDSAFVGLQYGKINGKQTSSAKFGDIDVAVGYNFLANDRSHLGVALRFTGPTGNKPTAEYVLEPVWGNGGHWGLGGEVFGHATLWQGHDDRELQLWGDIQVQHLFKAAQVRSFDLTANGAGSKYLLVADFGTAGTTFGSGSTVQQLINVSSLAVNSTVGAEVDMALMLQYNCHNWQFDLGYNFAGKSKETLALVGALEDGRYGVIGHQFTTAANTAPAGVATNKTQPAFVMNTLALANASGSATTAALATNVQTADLNVSGAAQAAGWSSKVFGQVAYRWNDSDYVPTLALQGSGEFSTSGNNALNQWSVGVRGGFSF